MGKGNVIGVKLLTLIGILVVLFSSCLPEVEPLTPEKALQDQLNLVDKYQLQADLKAIDDSLSRWGITPLKEPFGVRYSVQQEGTGAKPTLSKKIKAKYSGRILKTGALFTKASDTLDIQLLNLILGWQTALPLIPEGSKFTLYIPSPYGYGNVDYRDPKTNAIIIPKNSNLVFDIELLSVHD